MKKNIKINNNNYLFVCLLRSRKRLDQSLNSLLIFKLKFQTLTIKRKTSYFNQALVAGKFTFVSLFVRLHYNYLYLYLYWLSICMSFCLYVCLFYICLFVCLSECLYVCMSICIFVYLSLYVCISICIFIVYSHFY